MENPNSEQENQLDKVMRILKESEDLDKELGLGKSEPN
jgi:hypothetical protein